MCDQPHNAARMRGVDARKGGKPVTGSDSLHPTTQTSDRHPCAPTGARHAVLALCACLLLISTANTSGFAGALVKGAATTPVDTRSTLPFDNNDIAFVNAQLPDDTEVTVLDIRSVLSAPSLSASPVGSCPENLEAVRAKFQKSGLTFKIKGYATSAEISNRTNAGFKAYWQHVENVLNPACTGWTRVDNSLPAQTTGRFALMPKWDSSLFVFKDIPRATVRRTGQACVGLYDHLGQSARPRFGSCPNMLQPGDEVWLVRAYPEYGVTKVYTKKAQAFPVSRVLYVESGMLE